MHRGALQLHPLFVHASLAVPESVSCRGYTSLHAQVGRDSIPLFVRDSYAVSDSVSLDRQSLNGLEPFGRSTHHTAAPATASAAAAPPSHAASSMPLGTLHEEASFMEDLPPKVRTVCEQVHVCALSFLSLAAAPRHRIKRIALPMCD